jgi:hypothetical protein
MKKFLYIVSRVTMVFSIMAWLMKFGINSSTHVAAGQAAVLITTDTAALGCFLFIFELVALAIAELFPNASK